MPFRGMRVFGDHVIARSFTNLLPVQDDSERTEIDVVQFEGGCEDAELPLLEIERDLHKLLFQGG
jgi:hypothetical protein